MSSEDLYSGECSRSCAARRERREDIALVQHFPREGEEHNSTDAVRHGGDGVRTRYRGAATSASSGTHERLMIMTLSETVRVEDLPADLRSGESSAARPPVSSSSPDPVSSAPPRADAQAPGAGTLREFKDAAERAYLVQKLRENNWNISKTAEIIDTPRSNLYKKLEQYGIKQEVDG